MLNHQPERRDTIDGLHGLAARHPTEMSAHDGRVMATHVTQVPIVVSHPTGATALQSVNVAQSCVDVACDIALGS